MKRQKLNIIVERKTFHVFQGIDRPELKMTFTRAVRDFEKIKANVSFIYVSTGFILKNKWTPKDLVDWLLHCDYHIILSHIHQGKRKLYVLNC